MSTETVMFFWFIHLVVGIVIPALIYCDVCQMREEAKPDNDLVARAQRVQRSPTENGVSHVETIAMTIPSPKHEGISGL